ncbi:MAG: hypothetical protein ACFFG0_34865, partial [Candidatus Thorarchaeota archaeon]
MIPRLNAIALNIKLIEFYNEEYINNLIIPNFINGISDKQEKDNFILISSRMFERRMFSITEAIKATFKGKRGVIVSDSPLELKEIMSLINEIFPGIKSILINDEDVNGFWWNGVPEGRFKGYNIILCSLTAFIRLKYDFRTLTNNIGAICFHDFDPTLRSYHQLLSLIIKLKSHNHQPLMHFTSSDDFPDIRAICSCKPFHTYHLFGTYPDIAWYKLIIQQTKESSYIDLLSEKIQSLYFLQGFNLVNIYRPKILVLTHSIDKKELKLMKRNIHIEVQNIEDGPKLFKKADVILIEDNYLQDEGDYEYWERTIPKKLEYLKPEGKVIFFSNYIETPDLKTLSSLFPIKNNYSKLNFNKFQKEEFLLFLFFHKTFTKDDLLKIFRKFSENSNLRISQTDLEFLLRNLTYEGLIKENKGKYCCTSVGKTVIRRNSLIPYKKIFYLNREFRKAIWEAKRDKDRERILNMLSALAHSVKVSFKRYPYEVDVQSNIDWAVKGFSDYTFEIYEEIYGNNPEGYKFREYLFSRINPFFKKFNPYARKKEIKSKEESQEKATENLKSVDKRIKRPRGRAWSIIRFKFGSKEKAKSKILKIIREKVKEKNLPIYWRDVSPELSSEKLIFPLSTLYRLIIELENEKKIKTVSEPILEPRSLNKEKNRIRF